jgi:hypothetical protein
VRHAQAGRDNLLPQHAEVDLVLEEYVDESVNYTDLPAAPNTAMANPIATRAAQAGVRP